MKKALFITGAILFAYISSFGQNYISGIVSLHGDNTSGGTTIVAPGASLILNKNKLYAQAGFINQGDSTAINADSGTLVMSGTGSQGISGRFKLGALQVNNNAGVSISTLVPVTMVTILDSVAFGNINNGTLNAGDGLMTLRSNVAKTARIADLTHSEVNGGNTVSGRVIAERYIRSRRAWHLLSPPTTADSVNDQTIMDAWQEGVRADRGQVINPKPGYGTVVTRPSTSPASATGYDDGIAGSTLYSIKAFHSNGLFMPPPNTDLTHFSANAAYFLFVRGDRSVAPDYQSNTNQTPPTITTLRSKGALHNGDVTETVTKVSGEFSGIANPYACTVDFGKLVLSGVVNGFYTWDPSISTYGAWVYIDGTDNFNSTPLTPSGVGVYTDRATNALIQSGQGIVVKAIGTSGTVTFKESSKNITSRVDVFRLGALPAMHISLFSKDSSHTFLDGTTTVFDASFSREAKPDEDIAKPGNTNENISFFNSGSYLMKEKRPQPVSGDTLPLRLWKTSAKPYTLSLTVKEMQSTVPAYLLDNYLKSSTAIQPGGTTDYDFQINGDAESKATDRFAIVFGAKVLPVTFTKIKADWNGTGVDVQWNVQTETGIAYYEVERSVNGISFTRIGTVKARGSSVAETYTFADAQPAGGDNFYRVKSVDQSGKITYTNIASATVPDGKMIVNVYPNPVKDRLIKLWFKNAKEGVYQVQVYSNDGKMVLSKAIAHPGGTQAYTLPAARIAQGLYQAVITEKGNEVTHIPVIIE